MFFVDIYFHVNASYGTDEALSIRGPYYVKEVEYIIIANELGVGESDIKNADIIMMNEEQISELPLAKNIEKVNVDESFYQFSGIKSVSQMREIKILIILQKKRWKICSLITKI